MLDPESEQIREVYAFFGLAIYNAQSLERELAMVLAASGTTERFTAWDYDDTLAGNFDSTFGATGACEWKVGDSVECAIVFTSDAGNLILGRTGLCLGPQGIALENLHPKPEFINDLPGNC